VAEQASGTVAGTGGSSAALLPGYGHPEHNPGRPISWVGTSVVIVGFIIGGIAFVPTPHWLFFWIGAAVAIFGCLILLFSKAMHTDWY
jgi:hypothetical protein